MAERALELGRGRTGAEFDWSSNSSSSSSSTACGRRNGVWVRRIERLSWGTGDGVGAGACAGWGVGIGTTGADVCDVEAGGGAATFGTGMDISNFVVIKRIMQMTYA